MERIALHRPGATGDIIMTLNLVPLLKLKYPGCQIDYYCHPSQADRLCWLMDAVGVSNVFDHREIGQRASEYDQAINLVGWPIHDGYPEKPVSRQVLWNYAEDMGLELDSTGELPRAFLDMPPSPFSITDILAGSIPEKYATIHIQSLWSHYKNWNFGRWSQVLGMNPDIPTFQIGSESDYRLPGADHRFMGTHMSVAIALMAHATMHMGVDSFTNHLSHYEWGGKGQTPSVIVWGSTQPTASGYPHNRNIWLQLPCQPCFREDPKISKQPRGPCINPPGQVYEEARNACMEQVTVEMVHGEIRSLWEAL